MKAWADKYNDQGLVVIGVHAPGFAFEKKIDNVQKAVTDLGITYPVAIDNAYAIWRSFNNQYWPAHCFADAQGRIRHHHFGEGNYDESEHVIQQLLAKAGHPVGSDVMAVKAAGAEEASPGTDHGTDVGADGQGTVTSQRLYPLVRQAGSVGDHTFEITYMDPGVQAFAFTFG